MMSEQIKSGASRRLGLAAVLLVLGSSTALAFGFNPAAWKVTDSGKTVRQRQAGMAVAVIKNKGPDHVTASSKGKTMTVSGIIPPGTSATLILPKGAKKVKLLDTNFANGKGSRGSLVWATAMPQVGPIIGGGSGGGQ